MKTVEELTEMFRVQGRKVTPQRQRIFKALQGNDAHPTAEVVFDQVRADMETVSLKTVYQTLNDLVEMGELGMLDVGTGSARFDPNVESQHHHLVCTACGMVRDLHADFGALRVPVGQEQGFEVGSAEVVFRGRCESCSASGDRTNGESN